MNKKIMIPLTAVLSLSVLAACGSDTSNQVGSGEKPGQEQHGDGGGGGKPDVIKVFLTGGANFPEGEDINNNPWTKLIEKEANVDLQIEYGPSAADEYMNKLTLKFASNEIPDFFVIPANYQNWLVENAELGALMELDGKLEPYTNLMNAVYPNAWEAAKSNGKIYGIPVLNDGNKATNNIYIRKDWLDKMNLEVPQTLEEFEQVAKAFREQDPNNTYAMVAYENMLGWSNLFGAFGVIPGYWVEKDGKLVQADIQPEMKEALAYIRKLHTEKLLDNEWPITKIAAYKEKVANNQVGFFEGSWAAPRGEINTSRQNDPNANWIPIAPPIGPGGKQGVAGGPEYKSFAVISSQAKNVEAILRMLDWMAVPETIDKFVFGFDDLGEGFMYTVEDGKYAMNFENHNKYGYRQQLMFMQPKELNVKKMEALGAHFNLVGTIEHSSKYGIPNQYMGPPTPTMVEKQSGLDNLREKTFVQIIVGELPLDAFDSFVEEYKQKGGDEIAKEVQEWYESTK